MKKKITIDLGTLNPKQARFFAAKNRYVAYGGARGGGKSWAARTLAAYLCLTNPGLRALIMRRTYPELEENHIFPLKRLLPEEAAKYAAATRSFVFKNGSRIRLGHLNNTDDVGE